MHREGDPTQNAKNSYYDFDQFIKKECAMLSKRCDAVEADDRIKLHETENKYITTTILILLQ